MFTATTAEERITQSRVRLLMNKPFFGTLATRLRLQEFICPQLQSGTLPNGV